MPNAPELPEKPQTPRAELNPGGRICDLPDDDRPREKLARSGAGALSDSELLALFLRSGTQKLSAVELGRKLVREAGSLQALSRMGLKELQKINGIGPAKASELTAAFEIAARLARERFTSQPIRSAQDLYDMLGPAMAQLPKEELRVVLLNHRGNVTANERISQGSDNQTVAEARDILGLVLRHGAPRFILAHNHPSGDPTPSQPDRAVTRQIERACVDLRIELLDHVIFGLPLDGRDPYFSFRDSGLLI